MQRRVSNSGKGSSSPRENEVNTALQVLPGTAAPGETASAGLGVEAEQSHVAVLENVFLAFEAVLAGLTSRRDAAQSG